MNDQPLLDGQRIVTVRPSGRVSGPPRPIVRAIMCDHCGEREFVPRYPEEDRCEVCRPRWAA
jgi:hypothetical protein